MRTHTIPIRLALSESTAFLDALFDLRYSIEHADNALLPNDITEAQRAVATTLSGMKFKPGNDEGLRGA